VAPDSRTYKKTIVYVDGFSGPGEYTGGEPGSPIIALETARTPKRRHGGGGGVNLDTRVAVV